MQTLDDTRDDDIRPEGERGGEVPADPRPGPWEPSRDDAPAPEPPEPPPDEPASEGPQPEEDLFTRLNAPPGAAPDAAEPPFVVTERDLGGDEAEKAPSKAATIVAFGVVVLAVLGVLMTVASIKLFTERAEVNAALEQSVSQLSAVYAGPGTSDTSKRRIAWLQKAIDRGDYAQAQNAIESLGAPEVERPSPLESPNLAPGAGQQGDGDADAGAAPNLPSPEEDTSLPVAAQAFFEQHPDLWEAFFRFSVTIKQMEQREMPVEQFMQLRSQMVEAAVAGDATKVEDLIDQAREAIESIGSGGLPASLQDKLQEFRQAIQQAQRERRDVRAALQLAKKSERAAQQGDIKRAERLMDQAIAAVKDAPRMRMPSRPSGPPGARADGRMPQMGPEIGLIKFVADLASNVMRTEEQDLTEIWESIKIAAGAIREKNADQVREILGDARDALESIGDRRRKMSAAIAQARERVMDAREEAGERPPSAEAAAEQQERRQQIVMQRVARILAQVREMPEEEFEANRADIAQAVLQAMTAPVQMPGEQPERPDLTPEERVRRKMEIAGEIYHQIKAETDCDTTELDEKFSKVRELITEHEYERAEKLVDEGVEMMREMVRGLEPPQGEQPEDAGGYGSQLEFDAKPPSLELGPTTSEGDRPDAPVPADDLPAVPGDAESTDDTNEGVEQ